jgi:hypothetical protein
VSGTDGIFFGTVGNIHTPAGKSNNSLYVRLSKDFTGITGSG